ncbi:MAG: Maf family protein [Peptoniphilus sp.]|nr:Maf family protein [Peptoniphilus sp.]MDD7363677.1 Maf family protein [Bacillota bacterium]MDY6044062.1 Maf family protein [Peptoniphilus sp.]
MSLILASTSPRRRDLLDRAKIAYSAVAPKYDESTLRVSAPEIYVMQLAYQKAMSVKEGAQDDVVLALDTVVAAGDEILGKPKDRQDAEAMLNKLKGRRHRVITGYCILGAEKYVDYDVAYVTFEDFSDDQLASYLDHHEFLDKAGAYGIQDIEEFKVDVEGDRCTVIGMPVEKVLEHLKGEGIG